MRPITLHAHRRLAVAALCAAIALCGCGRDTPTSLVASGNDYLAKKDARAAVIQFKAALQAEPQSAEVRYLLGQALLEAGDPAAAVVELSKAMDQRFDDNKVLPPLSRALLLTGGMKKLTTLYGSVTLSDKQADAALRSNLATAWGALGDRAKAQAALDAALATAPDFPQALVLQARLVASDGQVDAALATIERVLARDSHNYEAWQLKGEILSGPKADSKGAEQAFRQALAAEKAFVAAHSALVALYVRNGDIAAAKAQAGQLRAVLPKHPQTLLIDAQLAFYDKDLPKARELVQLLLRGAPDNLGVLQLAGAIEGAAGSLVMSQNYFSKALSINPELPMARRNLARAYLRSGQAAKARAAIEPLLEADGANTETLAIAGDAALQLGDSRGAEALFLRAAKSNPEDQRALTALALMKLSRGEADLAFNQLQSISAVSQNSYTDMALISARLKRKEYDGALAAINTLQKKQPSTASVLDVLGQVQLARKDYPAARKAFDDALRVDPLFFSATSNLAALDLLEGKPEQARKRLEAAVAADKRNHFARMALAQTRLQQGAPLDEVKQILQDGIAASPSEPAPRLQLIQLLSRKKKFKEALAAAQEGSAILPNDVDLLDALGLTQMQAGDTQQAISTFRRLTAVDPNSARPHVRLADVYRALGNKDGAISSLKRALEIEPTLESAQASLIDLLLTNGRPRDALEIAREMQRRLPASAAGYLLEGAVHVRTEAKDAAIAAYRNGIERASSKSDLAVGLHRALMAAKRNAEADRFGTDWLASHPNDAAVEYQLATGYILRGDLARAEHHLSHVVALRPNLAMALNNLAWVLVQSGKPGAVAYAQRAVDALPNRPPLMDTLALALAADKQIPKALELQKRAVEIAPGDMGLRLNLARIALQAGDKTLARTELDRLASMGAKLPFQPEVTKLRSSL